MKILFSESIFKEYEREYFFQFTFISCMQLMGNHVLSFVSSYISEKDKNGIELVKIEQIVPFYLKLLVTKLDCGVKIKLLNLYFLIYDW